MASAVLWPKMNVPTSTERVPQASRQRLQYNTPGCVAGSMQCQMVLTGQCQRIKTKFPCAG